MELEKKKETQWVIKKHNDPNKVIYLKSIEESGIIVKISIGIRESEKELTFETNPEEFKNLYAIFKSFRDLLYSEGLDILHEAIKQEDSDKNLNENNRLNTEEYVSSVTEKELANLKKIEHGLQEEFKDDEINYDEKSIEEYEKVDEILEDLKEIPSDKKTQEILKAIDEIQVEQGIDAKETSDFKGEDHSSSNSKKEKNFNDKLDPTEWDPW